MHNTLKYLIKKQGKFINGKEFLIFGNLEKDINLLDDDIFEKHISMSFDNIASILGVSTNLIELKYSNLSDKKKKELKEIYMENYSVLYSI